MSNLPMRSPETDAVREIAPQGVPALVHSFGTEKTAAAIAAEARQRAVRSGRRWLVVVGSLNLLVGCFAMVLTVGRGHPMIGELLAAGVPLVYGAAIIGMGILANGRLSAMWLELAQLIVGLNAGLCLVLIACTLAAPRWVPQGSRLHGQLRFMPEMLMAETTAVMLAALLFLAVSRAYKAARAIHPSHDGR